MMNWIGSNERWEVRRGSLVWFGLVLLNRPDESEGLMRARVMFGG